MQVLTRKSALDSCIAILIGSIVFVYVTGGSVVLPWNRSWLMFGDSAQHYLGWEFFRQTPILNWPIGANYPFGMEVSSSIVFSDSIPIAAFIAKLFNPLLPVVFQYLGFWILACFVMQAFFAIKVFRLLEIQTLASYLGACLLAISPPLIYRTVHAGYGHIALASHWIIIASIYLYLKPGRNNQAWSALFALSWLVQAYFAPMVALVWVASLVKRRLCGENFLQLLGSFTAVTISSVLALWLSGYFIIGDNFNPDSWNYIFHWQPLSLVDPGTYASTGWSSILPDRPDLDGANEGFSYLGLGIFTLMAISIVKLFLELGKSLKIRVCGVLVILAFLFFRSWKTLQIPEIISRFVFSITLVFVIAMLVKAVTAERSREKFVPLIIAVSLLAFYSMTNRIGFGQKILFEYPLFPPLREFTHTFRTHARSIWPAYYLVIIASVVFVSKVTKRNLTILILLSSLVIQVADSSPAVSSARKRFTDVAPWESPMKDQRWLEFAGRYSKVVMVPPDNNYPGEMWIPIDDYAARNGMQTNSGYFSRYDELKWDQYEKSLDRDLRAGIIDTDTLYFIRDLKHWVQIRNSNNSSKFYRLDGYNLIVP
jgi:hypothetical protein